MQNIGDGSVATRDDPIWHRLRVERNWYLLLGVIYFAALSTTIYSLWNTSHQIAGWFYVFCLLALVKMTVDRLRGPAYWQRIGQRRDEALHGAQILATAFQPVHVEGRLSIPMTFSLRLNRTILTLGKICAGLAIVLWIIVAVLLLKNPAIHNDWFTVVLVVGVLLTLILITYGFRYFVFMRYYTQRIEITDDGLRVYYLRQERFMRWDEMRVFASYGAQGVAKSNQVRAYEVASEQMVIRWSQLPAIAMFFSAQSSLDRDEDWNWLVNRLNTHIVERTGLTLLELGDKTTRLSSWSMPSPARRAQIATPAQESDGVATAAESVSAPIAQDDTLVKRLQWNGDLGNAFKLFAVVSVVLLVVGVLSFSPATAPSFDFLSRIWGNAFIFLAGILLLACTILIGILIPVAYRYWRRIKALRLQAFSQVQFSALQERSDASSAPLPQPTQIRTRINWLYMAVISFFVTFMVVFLLFYFFGHPKNLWVDFFICLGLAFFCSLVQIPLANKSTIQRIEVTEDGIATYMNNLYNYLRWEDVRLFSSYRSMALFNRRGGSSVMYELAGEKTVVRMLGTAKNWNHFYVSQPKMSRVEFEHWQAQLADYIKLRTNLSRIDLDNLNPK